MGNRKIVWLTLLWYLFALMWWSGTESTVSLRYVRIIQWIMIHDFNSHTIQLHQKFRIFPNGPMLIKIFCETKADNHLSRLFQWKVLHQTWFETVKSSKHFLFLILFKTFVTLWITKHILNTYKIILAMFFPHKIAVVNYFINQQII